MPNKFYTIIENPQLAACKNAQIGSVNPHDRGHITDSITDDPDKFSLKIVLCLNKDRINSTPKDITCTYHAGRRGFGDEVELCEFYNKSIVEIEADKNKLKLSDDDMKQSMFSEKDMTG